MVSVAWFTAMPAGELPTVTPSGVLVRWLHDPPSPPLVQPAATERVKQIGITGDTMLIWR
jgi:hypothetical protein